MAASWLQSHAAKVPSIVSPSHLSSFLHSDQRSCVLIMCEECDDASSIDLVYKPSHA